MNKTNFQDHEDENRGKCINVMCDGRGGYYDPN